MDARRLQALAREVGAELTADQADRLIRYVAELERWNARFNLISRRDIGRVWPRHILDSLSIAPLVSRVGPTAGMSVFDVGTGAGLPGLPLAIALPESTWLLLDRNQRKIRFLETVISQLGLENVTARVADLGRPPADDLCAAADIVVSRAVDEPEGLLTLAEPLLKPDGRLVLMTAIAAEAGGEAPADAGSKYEPAGVLGGGFVVAEVHELVIPGLDRTHEVTIIERPRNQQHSQTSL